MEYYERQREYRQQRREKLLAAGLCTRCGKRPTVNGKKVCMTCREKERMHSQKIRDARRAEGKCIQCGGEIEPERQCKTSTCKLCALQFRAYYMKNLRFRTDRQAYNREHQREVHAERLRNGLCITCGNPNDREGRKMCSVCAEKDRIAAKRLRDEYRSQGLCVVCGKPIEDVTESYTLCRECRINRSMRYFARKEARV